MATKEEMHETIETLKGPRFYRIQFYGYGGEAEYMKLTKEQYEFWKEQIDENGDGDAVNYVVNAEDEQFDFEHISALDDPMKFLSDEDGPRPWYEAPTGFTHQWGVDYSNANISVDEVDSEDYSAGHVADVVESSTLNEWCEVNEVEVEMGVDEVEEPDYVAQMWSAEKGTFFDGIIETVGDFDPKKLKIYTSEYLNGDDTIQSVEYDGNEIDNQGGDTNGKGYSFHVWSNVKE
jgi:hypothetical protein